MRPAVRCTARSLVAACAAIGAIDATSPARAQPPPSSPAAPAQPPPSSPAAPAQPPPSSPAAPAQPPPSSSAAPARAQPPPSASTAPSAPAPVLVMPAPLAPLAAAYPEGGEGDATVIVKLVVEKDGSVSDVALVEGKEPFAASALRWARTFRFSPATRDGAPIKAAIRAEVRFVAPAPASGAPAQQGPSTNDATPPNGRPASPQTSAGTPTGTPSNGPSPNSQSPNSQSPNSQSPNGSPAPKPADEPIDVNVRGFVPPPGATTMSRAEVRLLPGAFGDPFRAVEALPGVTPIASGIPYFFVRGAPPGNVGYFLDGIRVPLLYHLGLGPSVVHPAIVDRVDLYSGGYPAQFGRFAGAVVSGETRGPKPEINGEAQLRLVDAGAMLEVPFAGGKGSALAGGRYSYTGLLFTLVQSDLKLDYWDYQARVSYDFTPSSTVTLFAFGARDFLGDKSAGEDRTLVDTTFHRVDLRYDRKIGPGSTLRLASTFGYDRTGFEGGGVDDMLFAARAELRYVATPTVTVRAGADASIDVIDASLDSAVVGESDPGAIPIDIETRHDLAAGAYTDAIWNVTDRLEVTPGLRVNVYGSTGTLGTSDVGIEPRLSSVLRVAPWLRFVQAHGFATQRPSFFLPGPGFTPNMTGGLQKSFQSSAGIEADLPLEIEGKLILFRSAFFDMTDAFGTSTFTDLITPENVEQRSLGSAIGMEVSLRRRMTKRLGGFLSYTLSDSQRVYGLYHLRAGTNRTHVLNAALGWDIGRGFRAGARFVFYTGFPNIVRGPDPRSRKADTGEDLPPFFRLDARVEKRWTLGPTRWISLVLEMQNTTLSIETLGVRCDRVCKPVEVGPVAIPSIGLEGGI